MRCKVGAETAKIALLLYQNVKTEDRSLFSNKFLELNIVTSHFSFIVTIAQYYCIKIANVLTFSITIFIDRHE